MKTREALKTVGGEHSTNCALLIVTDVQQAGDAFNVLDFGTAVGSHIRGPPLRRAQIRQVKVLYAKDPVEPIVWGPKQPGPPCS